MLDQIILAVRDIARDELMPRYLAGGFARKADGSLLTEADTAVQRALATRLARIAKVPLIGEEMSRETQERAWHDGEGGLWCVDPIDGTTNFVQGLPYFAISVGYLERGKSRLGVVYNPVIDELFAAERGRGASLNGVPMQTRSNNASLADCVGAVEPKYLPPALAREIAANPPFYSQRNWGAGAIDLCYVAAGRFDVYVHGGQKLWDYAAASLVLEEAGGAIASFEHDDFWAAPPWSRSIIAACDPRLFGDWLAWVRLHGGTWPTTVTA